MLCGPVPTRLRFSQNMAGFRPPSSLPRAPLSSWLSEPCERLSQVPDCHHPMTTKRGHTLSAGILMGCVPFLLCLSISRDHMSGPPHHGPRSVLLSSRGQPRIHLAAILLRPQCVTRVPGGCGPGAWLSVGHRRPVPGRNASCHPPEPQRVGAALPEPPRSGVTS